MGEQIGKSIKDTDRISASDAQFYSEIDGLKIIEELLYFKGCEVIDRNNTVPLKMLEDVAHIHYRLKRGATNKLYVGYFLDRYYRRNGLIASKERVIVPQVVMDRVKEEKTRLRRQTEATGT
jgi:hypothetical protein